MVYNQNNNIQKSDYYEFLRIFKKDEDVCKFGELEKNIYSILNNFFNHKMVNVLSKPVCKVDVEFNNQYGLRDLISYYILYNDDYFYVRRTGIFKDKYYKIDGIEAFHEFFEKIFIRNKLREAKYKIN